MAQVATPDSMHYCFSPSIPKRSTSTVPESLLMATMWDQMPAAVRHSFGPFASTDFDTRFHRIAVDL